MIIEIVDIVFTILFDNSSSSSFPLPVFEERELGELVVVERCRVMESARSAECSEQRAEVINLDFNHHILYFKKTLCTQIIKIRIQMV